MSFLFPVLSGCEDIVIESLSAENMLHVLNWSQEAHGSAWVHRQTLHFLREEFLAIAQSPVLCELSREYMVEAVKSDFLQVDILLLACLQGNTNYYDVSLFNMFNVMKWLI